MFCPQLDSYYFDYVLPEIVCPQHKPSYIYLSFFYISISSSGGSEPGHARAFARLSKIER